jgi:DNA topoisomerase I
VDLCDLVFVTDAEPGIRRTGEGRRTRYVDEGRGTAVTDEATLERIRRLAVPPAWRDVWISRDPAAHLQATGRDARGRKQYRYHPAFRAHRESTKFDQLVPFGHALGDLRRHVHESLARPGLGRERVVATVVRLLEQTFVRIGNEAYARENRSFGLTTLQNRHVDAARSELRFRFTGKGGRRHDVAVGDPRLSRMVRRLQDLPGQGLFQYVDDDGEVRPIRSHDVNDYLRDVTGLDVTAKTFRTWGGTLLAAAGLAAVEPLEAVKDRQAALRVAIDVVSEHLGNTPAVCRASYIHPRVIDAHLEGTLRPVWDGGPRRAAGGLIADERRLLRVLERRPPRRRPTPRA